MKGNSADFGAQRGQKMKKQYVLIATIMILLSWIGSGFGQDVSDEAKRHFDRGMAAVEMAKSPNDYAAAITEFEQAARLAPDWPDVYYYLGKVQETAEKYGDAARSFRQYLRLVPDAEDADEIKSLINKLEYKMEQVLTIPDIIKILVEFRSWKYTATLRTADRGCRDAGDEFYLLWEGSNSLRVIKAHRYYQERDEYQILKVTGPVLKYITILNICTDRSTDQEEGGCDSVIENEVEVVSRTLVKVNQTVLRGGVGAGTATGDVYSCTFEKEESEGINANNQSSSAPQDINAKDQFGRTPLHNAASKGQKELAERLIAEGADINAKDNDCYTPLHLAAGYGQKDVVELLIVNGAKINARNKDGNTPLYAATFFNHKDVADLLRKHGAK